MNAVKTLIILTPGFPANEDDSTCIPSRQIFVKALKEHSLLNIIVLAFTYPFIKKTYTFHGVTVISFNSTNKGKLRRVRLWLDVWTVLKKIKKENNVIGILSFWLGECALVGKYFAKVNGINQYTWLLGQDAKRGNKYVRLTKPTSSSLIALSHFIQQEFLKNYNIKPQHIIPVGIDTSRFSVYTQNRDIDILGVGSLIPLKQYDKFIKVIKYVAVQFPNIKVVVCGKGPEKGNLSSAVAEYNLQKNICFAGELPHNDVLDLMQQSKIFLHTSNYEGFGTVLAEALYAGTQVISFTNPMKVLFDHHHIAKNELDMAEQSIALLKEKCLNHERVLMYSAKDVTHKMLTLFNCEALAK